MRASWRGSPSTQVRRARSPGSGNSSDTSAVKGEQDGTRMLFAGAYAVLRNPAGHRQVDYADLSEAAEAVQTASLLMRILDRVEDRLLAAGRTLAPRAGETHRNDALAE
jgi:hypothetical protein